MRTQQTDIEEIFGKVFTMELMSSIHLRLYNYQETEEQIRQRADFKKEFSQQIREELNRMGRGVTRLYQQNKTPSDTQEQSISKDGSQMGSLKRVRDPDQDHKEREKNTP